MGKSVLFKNAKNTIFKKWAKDFTEKGGKELGEKVMDGIIDQSIVKKAPKNLSKLTKITKEAADEVKPKSVMISKDWTNRVQEIKESATGNKQFKKRLKNVRHKELNRVTKNTNGPKKLFTEDDFKARTIQKEAEDKVYNRAKLNKDLAEKRGSKIYGDKEAFKDFKFSKNGPKKLYPINDVAENIPGKEENFLRKAVPTAVGGAMIFTMMNRRGQQSNSQLYGQQNPYQ